MNFKIMITGKNRKLVASDISKHLEREVLCTTVDCPPLKSELLNTALNEKPKVILIFIKDEDAKDIHVYDVLTDYTKLHSVKVIVVCDENDKRIFSRNTSLSRFMVLPSHVKIDVICDRLNEIREEMEAEVEQSKLEVIETEPEVFTRKHILVVDDDAQQLTQIKEHLKEFYEVTVVNSGKLVMRCLERFRIDLIFLDYLMPEMTGPDVLKMIRGDRRFADIPVVFLTGVSEKDTVIKTIKEFKPQGYILKPTTKADIVVKVIEILG